MYTVKQTSKALGISDATLRLWGKRYEKYLLPEANPARNIARKYTDKDILALNTVKVLRSQGQDFDQIEAALEDGTRLEPTEKPPGDESPPASEQTALQTEAFTKTIASFEARLDKWEKKVDDLQGKLLEATERATAAETELRVLKEVTDQKAAEGEKLGFWARLFNRG